MIGIELLHGCSTYPRGSGRNEEQIRVLGHGREGRIGIFENEFSVGVLLPGGQHGLLVGRGGIHRKLLSAAGRDVTNGKLEIVSEQPSVILGRERAWAGTESPSRP